ncbi:MAG: cupredoxin domain-containing protein [Nitriliruptoraceae bacterium]
MMLMLPIGLVLLVLATVGLASDPGRRDGRVSAVQLLDARLARGEITSDEHRQRRQVLTDAPAPRASRGFWWALGALGVVLLVTGPLTTGASTDAAGWGGHPIGMAQHMGGNRTAAAPAEPPVSGAPEIRVEAGDLWFAPDRIELEAGRTVNLVLDNSGQAFHDLSLPELDVHVDAQPGETAATAVRVPEEGTYEFLCTVPGHAAGGMRGEVVVVAAP